MSEALDVIIPVAGKEVHFVHRVTAYVRKNLPEADTLYIITSNKNISYLKKKVSCQDRVKVLDEDKLVSGLTMTKLKEYAFKYTKCPSVGWYYQQFLKLGFALSIYAKNIFFLGMQIQFLFQKYHSLKVESRFLLGNQNIMTIILQP